MARRHDPGRRERIIDAAVRVVGVRGIAGLSHRAVATEAEVPLGSTTYHFAGLDDLLAAALVRMSERWLADIERWERSVDPAVPLADELARLVEESLAGGDDRVRVEYELYLAALRRPALRPLAAECLDAMTAVLRRRTADEATARALTGLIDSMVLQQLLTGRPFDRSEAREVLARILDHR